MDPKMPRSLLSSKARLGTIELPTGRCRTMLVDYYSHNSSQRESRDLEFVSNPFANELHRDENFSSWTRSNRANGELIAWKGSRNLSQMSLCRWARNHCGFSQERIRFLNGSFRSFHRSNFSVRLKQFPYTILRMCRNSIRKFP